MQNLIDSSSMKKLITFFEGSYDEIKNKVTWPPYAELQSNTALVLVASLIFALLIGVMDFVFKNGMEVIYSLAA